jgi:hypothetical protein
MRRLVLLLSVGLTTVLPCLLLPGTASASAPYTICGFDRRRCYSYSSPLPTKTSWV